MKYKGLHPNGINEISQSVVAIYAGGEPIGLFSTGSTTFNTSLTASFFNGTLVGTGSGSFSGSFQGDGSQLTGVSTTVTEIATVTSNFTSTTSTVVTHNFDSKNVIVSVYDNSDNQIIPQSINLTDNNNVTVTFSSPVSGFVVVAKGGHIVSGSVTNISAAIVNSSANRILTDNGDGTLTAETNFTFDGATSLLTGSSLISGTLTVNGSVTADSFTGSFSGSFQGDGTNLTNVVSSSYAVTASYALNAGGGAGFPFSGSAEITGSLNVTGSVSVNNYTLPETDGTAKQIIITDGAGNLEFDFLRTVYEQVKNVSGVTLQKGTPVHVTGSVGNTNLVIAASASVPDTMPATFILDQTLADEEEGLGIVLGFINGVNTSPFTEGQVVYVGENGGYTGTRPTGSNLVQNLGIVTKVDGTNGSGIVLGAGRTNDIPNLLTGEIFYGVGNTGVRRQLSDILSGSLYLYSGSFSGSFEGSGDNLTVNNQLLSILSSSFSTRITTNEGDISNLQTDSGSFSIRITTNEGDISNLQTDSGSFSTRLDTLENKTLVSGSTQIDHDQTTNFVANEHIDHSSVILTAGDGLSGGGDITTSRTFDVDSTVVRTTGNQTISGVKTFTDNNQFQGTQFFNNIAVNGTGSFAYIQSITGSAKIIGDAFIILNANTPAERYAGLKVFDSGSTDTGSLLYDAVTNHWFYESTNEGYASILLSGPTGSIGNLPEPTTNTVLKSLDGHHIGDSNITDDGSTITLGSNTLIQGTLISTGTTLISGSSQINHDSTTGFVSNEHIDHSSVSITAGDGLTGGGDITTSRTLNIGAGTGIDVAADSISVDVSDFMTSGSDNRVVTATGTDSMNAEANLTFDGTDLAAPRLKVGTGHTLTGTCATIAGGSTNTASANCSTVSGGQNNTATCNYSTIGGGGYNSVSATYATIAGGYCNVATNDAVAGPIGGSTVGGGTYNWACAIVSTISGGYCSLASAPASTIGGGFINTASGCYSTVGGGKAHTASGTYSTVGGGNTNSASSGNSTVGGGYLNKACGNCSTVSGGGRNTASGTYSTVGGGRCNTASGACSGILGGTLNHTCGYANSFIVGSNICATAACTTFVNNLNVAGNASAVTLTSTQATGTAPLTVASTTAVTNLNADLLDGNHASAFYLASNPSGYTTNTGTVTSVGITAGSGLTGGGTVTTSGTVTLNIGAGTGIDVAADAISVDVSDFMTNGVNNRVVTATGTDGMNAEANLTFDGSTLALTGDLNVGSGDFFVDDSAGRVGIGTTNPDGALHTIGDTIQQTSLNSATAAFYYQVRKSRGTVGTPLPVVNGDVLGGTLYIGYTGTAWHLGAAIRGEVDGTVTSDSVPTNLTFYAGPQNVITSAREQARMRITSTGNVGINTLTPTSKLHVSGSTLIESSGSVVFDIQGSQGQLFSVTDSLTGTLMSVNDISGIPILEVDSADKVTMGTYGSNALVVNGTCVGVGTATPSTKLDVVGDIAGQRLKVGAGHTLSGTCASVAGGCQNTASGTRSTVSGGQCNVASGDYSSIGAGFRNTVSGNYSHIGSGVDNTVSCRYSAIGGGESNSITKGESVIGGGSYNTASGCRSTIGGGYSNTASNYYSTVTGGLSNTSSGNRAFVGGGQENSACGNCSIVVGGRNNTASGNCSAIGGGYNNITNARNSTISGGYRNVIQSPTNECCSSGTTIGGGIGHNSSGGTINFAAGFEISGAISCCNAGLLSTIGGGFRNCATSNWSTVSGGRQNAAITCNFSTVSGGYCNTSSGGSSFIGGGNFNTTSGTVSAVAGGASNTVSGDNSFIGAGNTNTITGTTSGIVSGRCNLVAGNCALIGGGCCNVACQAYPVVVGGQCNVANSSCTFIGGGRQNCVTSTFSTIGGGWLNTVDGACSGILGGKSNRICGYDNSFIVGSCICATQACTLFTNHILPGTCATFDLGSTSYRWNNIYTMDLSLQNDHGDWTIVEGEDDLFIYNNKKGKVYKFNLTEVDPSVAPPKRS